MQQPLAFRVEATFTWRVVLSVPVFAVLGVMLYVAAVAQAVG